MKTAGPNAWLRLALVGMLLVTPSVAFATNEGPSDDPTLIVVALILAVGAAYLLAHFVVGRLQKTFLVLTGIEYLLLGFLLGPEVPTHIPAFSDLPRLLPIVALAVGWVGLLRGMEVDLRRARSQATTGATRVVIVQAVVTGAGVALAAHYAFTRGWLFPYGTPGTDAIVGPRQAWMSAAVMGCVAAAGSYQPIELLVSRYGLAGEMPERLRRMAALSDLVAIVAFGLMFCVFHTSAPEALVHPSATEWAVITLLLGLLLGVLFTPYLGADDSENGRFLAMVGIITLASGAAYFLDLSPLLVNLCLGIVLVNTARTGPALRKTLESTKRPMALVLLVFAGALWHPPDPIHAVLVTAGYVVLRFAGKVLGGRLAAWRTTIRKDYWRAVLGHGEVSVAMAVSFRLVYDGPAVDLAYTAILVSVVLNDLLAPRLLRGLLVDTGDIRREGSEPPSA
ncbi:MAG: hypothetical protein IT378_08675 [Sandaracinaceae bacterium]|nr:hypothetical protein [Sandaracinaceae bacterium]